MTLTVAATPIRTLHPGRRVRPLRIGQGPFYRMLLLNIGGLALLVAAWGEGWVQRVFASDSTGLTLVIAGVFAAGLAVALRLGWRISAEQAAEQAAGDDRLSASRGEWSARFLAVIAGRDAAARGIAGANLRGEMAARLAPVRQIAGSLVVLGLIGTVLGFILALSGISAGVAQDVDAVSAMITRLIGGMSVALFTTLEGAVLSLWLTVNHQILSGAAARLVVGLVARGEEHACA